MTAPNAEARHHVANLLHLYTETADRKDVAAAVDLLGDATVTFPTDGYTERSSAAAFFTRLWSGPNPHRHDVTNLVVNPADDGTWTASAHYTRYVFEPEPVLTTLGEYSLTVRESQPWRVTQLTVTRTWSR